MIDFPDEALKLNNELSEIIFELRKLESKLTFIESNKKWKYKNGSYYKKINSETTEEGIKSKTSKLYSLILHRQTKSNLKKKLTQTVKDLLTLSNNNHFYWRFSTIESYKEGMTYFLKLFKKELPESDITDFLEYELKYYSKNLKEPKFYLTGQLKLFSHDFKDYLPNSEKVKLDLIDKLKVNYLYQYANDIGYNVESIEDSFKFKKAEKSTKKEIYFHKDLEQYENYISIFKNEKAFQLFVFIDNSYIVPKAKTKYISFYHYFEDIGDILICTQLEYLNFIKDFKEVSISKITPRTNVFLDKIVPKLEGFTKTFNTKYEIE